MTLNEFKAWLEGFEAGMSGNPPTAEQWAAIKAKLDMVKTASPVPPNQLRPDTPFRASFGPLVGAPLVGNAHHEQRRLAASEKGAA